VKKGLMHLLVVMEALVVVVLLRDATPVAARIGGVGDIAG
jgi:hypothetical protein